MILTFLKTFADNLFDRLEGFSKSRFWLLKSVMIITVLTLFYNAQNYPFMIEKKIAGQNVADSAIASRTNATDYGIDSTIASKATLHEFVQRQINTPLIVVPKYPWAGWRYRFTQGRSRQFRLTLPVLGHYLHLNVNGLILLQALCGIFIFVLVILLVTRITDDRVLGLLFALGLGFTYLGKASFIDIRPWFIGMAYFFLLVSMFSKKPVIIGLGILLASFTDERALIASGLIFIWWKLQLSGGERIGLKDIFKPDRFAISVISAWAVYFVTRNILAHQYGLTGFNGKSDMLTDIKVNYRYFMLDMLTGIKWFEIFIGLGLILLLRLKYYFITCLLLLNLGILAFAALADTDITKSITFIFPTVFISLYLMVKKGESDKNLRYLTLAIVVLCFIMMTRDIPAA